MLDPVIQRWIYGQGWSELRDIQEDAIRAILAGQGSDVIIAASTASGKTEAAFLPLLTRAMKNPQLGVRLLYIGPLKALLNDQFARLEGLCEALEIRVTKWHGDASQSAKAKVRKSPEGVVLITPESLEALAMNYGLRLKSILEGLDAVVLDELHSLIGTERGIQTLSLLSRIEEELGRQIPRIGLSATLGDLGQAAEWMRPGGGEFVQVVESQASPGIQIRLNGILARAIVPDSPAPVMMSHDLVPEEPVEGEIVEQGDGQNDEEDKVLASAMPLLFRALKGGTHLVFGNSRHRVEQATDQLSSMCRHAGLPNQFFAHHGSLSRELRHDVEQRLREGQLPTSVVCTSTLEMGIDIGQVESVAQLGPPPGVAVLRQRVGRSGRRGTPSRLRALVMSQEPSGQSPLEDRIHSQLFEVCAMIGLMLDRWYEPVNTGALHLSTLVQQAISVIVQLGGATAGDLARRLIKQGPFRSVTPEMFARVLMDLGECGLLVQEDDGTLLLTEKGERVAGHYTFYAAFQTPEEYRIIADKRTLGTLPVVYPVAPEQLIVFAGRRWRVLDIDEATRSIHVAASRAGKAPAFGGDGVEVHHSVRQEMKRLYQSDEVPAYLDDQAKEMLSFGRKEFKDHALDAEMVIEGGGMTQLWLWTGDPAAAALSLILKSRGIKTSGRGLCLTAEAGWPKVKSALAEFAAKPEDPRDMLKGSRNLATEKHHPWLSEELLIEEAIRTRFAWEEGAMLALPSLLERP